jgi:protein-S-isoprenylcysteine O-methyltransferase Ste14
MRRSTASLGSLLFLILAPGTVAGLIPYWLTAWRLSPAPWPLRALGAALIFLGAVLLVSCFARFALVGRGTPAPVAPPDRLVVSGAYAHVRNPMYVALLALILGQAALLPDLRLVGYAAAVWLATHLFVLAYEEPTLRRSFPEDYQAFFAAVPRWIPRIRPWPGDSAAARPRAGADPSSLVGNDAQHGSPPSRK